MHTTEHGILRHVKCIRSVDDIGQIEVDNVVTCDDVRVHFLKEIAPCFQHFLFTLEGIDLSTNNWCTVFQCENVSHERFFVTVNLHYVCNLDDGVKLGLRETSFLS